MIFFLKKSSICGSHVRFQRCRIYECFNIWPFSSSALEMVVDQFDELWVPIECGCAMVCHDEQVPSGSLLAIDIIFLIGTVSRNEETRYEIFLCHLWLSEGKQAALERTNLLLGKGWRHHAEEPTLGEPFLLALLWCAGGFGRSHWWTKSPQGGWFYQEHWWSQKLTESATTIPRIAWFMMLGNLA